MLDGHVRRAHFAWATPRASGQRSCLTAGQNETKLARVLSAAVLARASNSRGFQQGDLTKRQVLSPTTGAPGNATKRNCLIRNELMASARKTALTKLPKTSSAASVLSESSPNVADKTNEAIVAPNAFYPAQRMDA